MVAIRITIWLTLATATVILQVSGEKEDSAETRPEMKANIIPPGIFPGKTSTTPSPPTGGDNSGGSGGGGSTGGGGNSGGGSSGGSTEGGNSRHPLDPLTESEIKATSNIILSKRGNSNLLFVNIQLKEPPKSELLSYYLSDSNPPQSSIPRKSYSMMVDPSAKKLFEAVVNLNTKQVESWIESPPDATPPLLPELMPILDKIAKENVTVQERCRKLGYSNMSLVFGQAWPVPGYIGNRPEWQGLWIYPIYYFGKHYEYDNQNAHPFDFIVVVDLVKRQVLDILDIATHDDFDTSNKEGNIVPKKGANFDPILIDPNFYRKDLKPVKISQDGISFSMDGYELKWQKFKMRIGFNAREGLVIYNVNYNDSGKIRPLFYRLSVSEMYIPYGDPRPPYHWRYVLDEGQVFLGFCANSLEAQKDCVGEVRFYDGFINNFKGESVKVPRAICVREEDDGVLWKHGELSTGKTFTVRSQRLSLTFVATQGHYDYAFTWMFYLDGRIEFKVQLTGIPEVQPLAVNSSTGGWGTEVSPQVNAPHHQHYFTIRADPEVDGNKNTVSISDVVPVPGAFGSATNPYGNGFTVEKTVLKTAAEGRTNVDPTKSRVWEISNPEKEHPYTKTPVAWKLTPFQSMPTMTQMDSPMRPFAGHMDYNTWVTAYKEDQLYAAGVYINKSGLPEWVQRDPGANIENTDVVLWHNFGVPHIVRTEDWPVMPEMSVGMMLKPYNFFTRNPSLDVPGPSRRRSFTTEL